MRRESRDRTGRGRARAVALATIAAAALATAGDRTPGPPRLAAPRAAAQSAEVAGWPRFALFGWVSPPIESTTTARIAEMAALGLDVLLPAWADSGRREDNLARLDLAAAHGMRALVWDRRFGRVAWGTAAGRARTDSIVADYREHPGFLGYYFGDEPTESEFGRLERAFAGLREADPAHPAWNNLLGRGAFPSREAWLAHTRAYLDATGAPSLSNDHYDFLVGRDVGLFVENATGLAAIARERGVPFWAIVLLVQHGPFRALTEGELRWQVSQLLALGARGVGYFTYWTPAPDTVWHWRPAIIDTDGARTPWYDVLARWHPRVRAAGERLADLVWIATEHAGSVPAGGTAFAPDDWIAGVQGRAAIGQFTDRTGRRHLLVANSDSAAARAITLELPGARGAHALEADGTWRELPWSAAGEAGAIAITLALAPGDFALVRIEGPSGAIAAGAGPRLEPRGNPARGIARFDVSGHAAGARLEVLDAQGRRVWEERLPGGRIEWAWRGERHGAGAAAPGIFLVRVEDARGVAAARLAWLGR